jgi:hypothetical protein
MITRDYSKCNQQQSQFSFKQSNNQTLIGYQHHPTFKSISTKLNNKTDKMSFNNKEEIDINLIVMVMIIVGVVGEEEGRLSIFLTEKKISVKLSILIYFLKGE